MGSPWVPRSVPERPDVFDAHPEAGPFSGFEQTLSMFDLAPDAKGEFEVRVTTADGSTRGVGREATRRTQG